MIHTIDGISQTVQYQGCVIPYSWEPRMNERIEELKQQAADYVDSIDNGIDIEEYRKLLDQKFAELIVKECIVIVSKRKNQAIDDGWNVDEAMTMAEMDLEEHFGIE